MKKMRQDEIFDLIKAKFPEAAPEEQSNAVVIPKNSLLGLAQYLKNSPLFFDNLHCVTAIDRKERIDMVYIFYSIRERHAITLKVYLNPADLNIASLTGLWKSADWLERETYDMFGVAFLNHPDPRRILNPYDWKGFPLRKDYYNPDFIMKPRY